MARSTDAQVVSKVTPKQQAAIEVLLVGGTDLQAAEAAGVNRSTVTGWRNESPEFAEALSQARRDLLRRTANRAHAARSVAMKAFEDVAKDTRHPGPRIAAARSIMEFSQREIELEELEDRIRELEARAAEQDRLRDRR